MRKLMWCILIIAFLTFGTQVFRIDAAYRTYKVKANQSILAFIGPIGNKRFVSVRFVTYRQQDVKLLHRRSGPGLYTFYIKDLVVKNDFGNPMIVFEEGYFIAKRNQIIINKIQ